MATREISPGLTVQGFTPPLRLADYKLIAFDMDSTLINIECVDEIAEVVGKGPAVAAITEAAMRGEISDFRESLARRLALLAGTPVSALQRVYEHRLRLNPGALELLAYARWDGLKILLVSGGFTYFTDRLKPRLGLDYAFSNQLEIEDGVLTGRVTGRVIDGAAKRDAVAQACVDIGCAPEQVIAVGDGANDLPMMQLAGLSVAYRAKPKVREYANVSIDTGGLNRLLEVTVPSVAYA
ncbi:phosphoserine phosphatase SerB [Ramlibacter monticola]|uniref:Phosphoserine phosphatase n=1 Tax=Ramlibacter monticola TaxID=1926872 RepID=A0A936Z2A9_9BURK|nr:phosphoserine phosphatase SerB [Ramlibacter monticola]MBL0393668.1 phosphoserine phosphatase SerB [Ramlibacter monticola]